MSCSKICEATSSSRVFIKEASISWIFESKDDENTILKRLCEESTSRIIPRDPSYQVSYEEEVVTNDGLMEETSRNSFRDVFKNIPNNTSEDFYESNFLRMDSDQEDHVCLKALREDNTDVTSLTHNKMLSPSVKHNKYNDKLEKNIINPKDYIKFLKNRKKIISEEIDSISESLKSNKCDSCEYLKMK